MLPMTLETPLASPVAVEGLTERFDPIDRIDQRALRGAARPESLAAGRYLEVDGPERSLLIPLHDGSLHIGRGLGADLRLEDMSVSRRHAILVCDASGARILDDRSSNGTQLNGAEIQQAELSDGDVITLGRFALRYLTVD